MASETAFIFLFNSSWTSLTVAPCAWTPTLTRAISGIAVTFPSPVTVKVSVFVVVTLVTENGMGPTNLV